MQTEFEAKFININKEELRRKLQELGATLQKPEFLQKRHTFALPEGHQTPNVWLRVRDEADKVTLSLKALEQSATIEGQKEIQLTIDNFDAACELLTRIGCRKQAYQESKREIWILEGNIEISLDEWPFMEPFIEIEGQSEEAVRTACTKLGFDFEKAQFGPISELYAHKYAISAERVVREIPEISFSLQKNPFID